MKMQGKNRLTDEEVAYAVDLSAAHAEGLARRCRRHRRWAAARRVAFVALLLAVSGVAVDSLSAAFALQPSAKGALPTDAAMECVCQMLVNL
jgi:hypothetical protein